MSDTEELLFSLLRIYAGKDVDFPFLDDDAWQRIYDLALAHSLVGVVFSAMEKLPEDKWPGKAVAVKFFGRAKAIRECNSALVKSVSRLVGALSSEGIDGVLLKGQGAALLYPDRLSRNPGDIDYWCSAPRGKVISFARTKSPRAKVFYHHIDAGRIGGSPVELHFSPSWMNSPFNNRRLQDFFRSALPDQLRNRADFDGVGVAVPTVAFNLIYEPVHIYRHVFFEGVGLRQLVDLYFTIAASSPDERAAAMRILESLGMRRFTAALMWAVDRVFGLDKDLFLCPPDKSQGEFLLREIMISGNFGCSDNRTSTSTSGRLLRLVRFAPSYPSEVLWAPFFKLYQLLFIRLRFNI